MESPLRSGSGRGVGPPPGRLRCGRTSSCRDHGRRDAPASSPPSTRGARGSEELEPRRRRRSRACPGSTYSARSGGWCCGGSRRSRSMPGYVQGEPVRHGNEQHLRGGRDVLTRTAAAWLALVRPRAATSPARLASGAVEALGPCRFAGGPEGGQTTRCRDQTYSRRPANGPVVSTPYGGYLATEEGRTR
ncbi:hypothetical protein QJS66_02370 [Kocuria rhizophila]|nr:hypothetical protein QJS66_02370 [Kocuria rhizophila]